MRADTKRKWLLVAVVVTGMLLGGLGMVVFLRTIVAGWLVTVICIGCGLAAAALHLIRYPLSGSGVERWMRPAAIAYLGAAVTFAAVMWFNRVGATEDSAMEVECEVCKKYTQTHKRYGRHHNVTGTYRTYHAAVALPDGREKDFSLSISRYNHIKRGDRVKMELRRGTLGWPVIFSDNFSGKKFE